MSTTWHPQAQAPHAQGANYWRGVSQFVSHSNLTSTVPSRAGAPTAVPLSAQPALSFGASLRSPTDGFTNGQTGR